jgi:hypothetical protein
MLIFFWLGVAKLGYELILAKEYDTPTQYFSVNPDGHVYVASEPYLTLGINDSILNFGERHVHLQTISGDNDKNLGQRWELLPGSNTRPLSTRSEVSSLKRAMSGASLGDSSTTLTEPQTGNFWLTICLFLCNY